MLTRSQAALLNFRPRFHTRIENLAMPSLFHLKSRERFMPRFQQVTSFLRSFNLDILKVD